MNGSDTKPTKQSGLFWGGVAGVTLVFLAVGYYIAEPLIRPEALPEEELVTSASLGEAKLALQTGDFQLAGAITQRLLREEPADPAVLLVAGEAAAELGDADAALRHYLAVPKSAQAEHVIGLWSAGHIAIYQGRLRAAEQLMRDAIALDPDNVSANQGLAFVLGMEGRRWESLPHLFEPIRQGNIGLEQLMLLATVDTRSADVPELWELAEQVDPDYWVPKNGLALSHFYSVRPAEAEKVLHEVLQRHPDLIEAHAMLGRIIVQRDKLDTTEYYAWLDSLPDGAELHPGIWYVQGVWAQEHGDMEGAARSYWEAIRIHPNYQTANHRLSRVLLALDRPADAELFGKRAALLQSLVNDLYPLFGDREKFPDPKRMMRVAQWCYQLGRYWEARAWYQLIRFRAPDDPEVIEQSQRLNVLTANNPSLVVPDSIPTNHVDLSDLPLPKRIAAATDNAGSDVLAGQKARFVDESQQCGIRFVYENGDDPDDPGMMLSQELGGAMAILDYDLDQWPDIYIAQGGPWPREPSQTQYRDRLFRNLGNGKFVDVTQEANLGDNLYSQGAAIGDIDNDGWPDIFVANLGENRIYRNQGDGTFTDVTELANLAGDRWSTSAAIADVNGDTLPDIYIVNYLAGQKPLITVCYKAGEARACPPHDYEGGQDRLYLNQGDGRFLDVTEGSSLVRDDGKGLGVVVGDFHGQGQLSIYVANDMTGNFFFVNEAARRGDELQLVDHALMAGVAFGREGEAQASMGIAVGDGDNDGLIDLFLAHYYDQSNTYYRQISTEMFEDATQHLGLREPSMKYLAFGTQFIDFENDGSLDIMLACGHVDDYRHIGTPYMMKPQAYANRGDGHFDLLSPETIGPYFSGEYLGRSLALLDWNRDGKQDVALLHLYVPSALLTNRSEETGHFLQLQLRGIESDRDAIGTTVSAHVGDRVLVRQIMAGDGFQCSSEKVVHFGLGDALTLDRLVVQWPSGTKQEFEQVAVDRELILLEGVQELVPVPRDDR